MGLVNVLSIATKCRSEKDGYDNRFGVSGAFFSFHFGLLVVFVPFILAFGGPRLLGWKDRYLDVPGS